MANGIPGGSPTRAPRSLGPRKPPLPPFGELMLGSIGRQLCPSRPGPRLPSQLWAGSELRGPRGRLAPGCAHVEPGWVRRGGGAGLGGLRTCPGLRLGDHCARVRMCVHVCPSTWNARGARVQCLYAHQQPQSNRGCTLLSPAHFLPYIMSSAYEHFVLLTFSQGLPTESCPIRGTRLCAKMVESKLGP